MNLHDYVHFSISYSFFTNLALWPGIGNEVKHEHMFLAVFIYKTLVYIIAALFQVFWSLVCLSPN